MLIFLFQQLNLVLVLTNLMVPNRSNATVKRVLDYADEKGLRFLVQGHDFFDVVLLVRALHEGG